MANKSAEEIIAEAERTIVHMHHRPTLYVGSIDDACSASKVDGMFWSTHWLWAYALGRINDLRNAREEIWKRHSCGSIGFVGAFHNAHLDATGGAVFSHVMSCWADIDGLLGIDITEQAFTSDD